LNANSTLLVNGGTLRFNFVTGAATIGSGVTATVASGATLQLAGPISTLSSGGNRVNVTNNSNATGLLVSGANQQVGNIDGSGTTQINAGSDLTANHFIQGALVIGGAAGSPAIVTIAASDASGNPLMQASSEPSGLLLAGSLASSSPFGASIGFASTMRDGPSSGTTFTLPSLGSSTSAVSVAAVPEPSTIVISTFALASLLGFGIGRRRKHRPF
jgi:hypothetical protein